MAGRSLGIVAVASLLLAAAQAQMIDNNQTPNTANAGINKSLLDEIGAGRGVRQAGPDLLVLVLIAFDPWGWKPTSVRSASLK